MSFEDTSFIFTEFHNRSNIITTPTVSSQVKNLILSYHHYLQSLEDNMP